MTTPAPTTTAVPRRAGRREWIGLAVLALPTLLLSIDVSVLYLALPQLSADLQPNATQTLWILDVYGFMVAGFLVTMGSLGDRVGRRRLLLIGASAFALLSVVAAYATSPGMLIVARGLLGIAGATLMPSTLSLITTMFRDPIQRGRAVAVWISCFMGGTIIGPVVGGVLLEHFWWGSAFLLGVPVMALLLVAGPVLLPEHRNADRTPLDLVGVVLSLLAILPVVYGVKDLAKHGVTVIGVAAILAGVAIGFVFARRQRRSAVPLVDLALFTNRRFVSALAIFAVTCVLMGGFFYLVSQFVQLVIGLEPLQAGLLLVPSSLAMIVVSLAAPRLAVRFGTARVIVIGLVVSAVGFATLATISSSTQLLLVIGMSLATGGMAPIASLGTDIVVGSVPPERAGQAAAASETSNELALALGVAVLGSIGAAVYRAGLPAGASAEVREGLGGALSAAGRLPAGAAELLATARDAFTSGVHLVAIIGAAVLLVTAWAARRMLADPKQTAATPIVEPTYAEA